MGLPNIGELLGGGIGEIALKVIGALKLSPEIQAQITREIEDHKFELAKMDEQREQAASQQVTQLALAQSDVNKTEATMDRFRGGWRPCVGYVCVIGLLYSFLFQPLMAWFSGIQHWPAPPPLETGTLLELLFGMLGLGTLRTVERVNGKS